MLSIGLGICYYNEDTNCELISIKRACIDAIGVNLAYNDINVEFVNNAYIINIPSLCNNEYNINLKLTHGADFVASCVCFEIDEKKKMYKNAIKRAQGNDNNLMSTCLIKSLIPKRNEKSHKGSYGKCYIVGGSIGLTGAAYFCSTSCVKCGSGLVSLGCPKSLNTVFETLLKEVMTIPLDDNDGVLVKSAIDDILSKANSSDVMLYGCGLSLSDDINEITRAIVKNVKIPLIIDADGINSLSKNIDILNEHKQPIVLTPHFMEFSRLSGKTISYIEENPIKCATDFSRQFNVTLVLKSERTVVAFPNGDYFINPLGNAGMATGGTGDVLAGAITSFVGQGLSCENAALLGVFLHSLAGDMSAQEKGMHSMTPSDILENIPYALKYLGG